MKNTGTCKISIKWNINKLSVQQNCSNQAKICMTTFLNTKS